MPDKPVLHGHDHRPGGIDPTPTGPWHYVHSSTIGLPSAWNGSTHYVAGNTVTHDVFIYLCILPNTNVEPAVNGHWANYWIIDTPIFQNGWSNQGGSLANMRYKLAVGAPNIIDKDVGTIVSYLDHQIEIQGSVQGGNYFTIIFWLPLAYTHDSNLRLPISDDLGGTTVMTVKSDGSVWKGLVA